jgi:hypothetical protein
VDYKEVLKPEEFEVFSRLRDWRRSVAEKEGVPVYAVLIASPSTIPRSERSAPPTSGSE